MNDFNNPLTGLEEWEEFLKERYPEPETRSSAKAFEAANPEKKKEAFRNYEMAARPSVREFYRLNHRYQTYDFGQGKRKEFLSLNRRQMGVWEALEYLNTLVDDSDPDTDLSQLDHLLQTAEQIRRDGQPRWFILAGLIHDLGKILNPDSLQAAYQTRLGVYGEHCGLDNVRMSWGHDEYLFHVVKDYLPPEALHMIRYHSFYPAHRDGEYTFLMNEQDRQMFKWVRAFNPYDLYTKSHARPNLTELRPFYDELIREYFPASLRW